MTPDQQRAFELLAYKIANRRPKSIRFTSMLFMTGTQFLLLDFDRGSWNPRWLGKAIQLKEKP